MDNMFTSNFMECQGKIHSQFLSELTRICNPLLLFFFKNKKSVFPVDNIRSPKGFPVTVLATERHGIPVAVWRTREWWPHHMLHYCTSEPDHRMNQSCIIIRQLAFTSAAQEESEVHYLTGAPTGSWTNPYWVYTCVGPTATQHLFVPFLYYITALCMRASIAVYK